MSASRRFLPSLAWLSAFEAVARRGSVTDAAEELDLTQGAVSRQVQKLEQQIGLDLFVREKKRLILTPAGASYAEDIRGAISKITNATIKLRSNPEGGTLELSILPAFGTHWLAPRLPDFLAANPGVTINLSTRVVPFDFAHERFHAAIHFGREEWVGAQALKLMDEEVVPVAAPELIAHTRISAPADLLQLPLLHLETRPNAWARWFNGQGVRAANTQGMGFDQFATMAKAASFGLGAALLPRFLAENDLETGRLVPLWDVEMSSIGAYYLVWPNAHADYPPLVAFRNWIAQE